MHQNRTKYPQKKSLMYQQLQELPKKYNVIALVRMEKVRSSQLLPLRKKFKGDVEIVSIKDKVAQKALAGLKMPSIDKMVDKLVGQCVLMFTNMTPFKLNILLGKNKIMMAARGGDLASIDVVIKAGNTGITPGPILTDFKEASVATKIDQGTIWITKDSIDVKPVEAGIILDAAVAEDILYAKNELVIDVEKYRDAFVQAHQEAMALAIEIGYITKENVSAILAKASLQARSVALEAGILSDETKDQVIQKANAQAKALAKKAKNYTPQ